MNILVIDAGNTRIKWGFSEHGSWLRQGWLPSVRAGDIATELAQLPAAQRIAISNVAGAAVREHLSSALRGMAAAPRWIVSAQKQCGVTSGYAAPETLGPDRWAGLIGAWHRTGDACVVVNAGTTMTVDALSREGVFLGGFIVPGFDLMRETLARDTANLAVRSGDFSYFPDNTGDAIVSGAVNALAGAVERMTGYMAQSTGAAPPVILSGGGAARIEGRISGRVTVVDNLVLEGLLQIASQTGT